MFSKIGLGYFIRVFFLRNILFNKYVFKFVIGLFRKILFFGVVFVLRDELVRLEVLVILVILVNNL